jgi:hypothetical protein
LRVEPVGRDFVAGQSAVPQQRVEGDDGFTELGPAGVDQIHVSNTGKRWEESCGNLPGACSEVEQRPVRYALHGVGQ